MKRILSRDRLSTFSNCLLRSPAACFSSSELKGVAMKAFILVSAWAKIPFTVVMASGFTGRLRLVSSIRAFTCARPPLRLKTACCISVVLSTEVAMRAKLFFADIAFIRLSAAITTINSARVAIIPVMPVDIFNPLNIMTLIRHRNNGVIARRQPPSVMH